MKVDAVLFDLDGTLVDSLADLARSVNTVLVARGHPPHRMDAYRRFVGEGIGELVRRALGADAATSEVDACVDLVRREYGASWDRETRPYPEIVTTLASLRARGLRLAVFSNKPHGITVSVAERFFGNDAFDVVLGAEAGFPRKPDPQGALEIARRLDVSPRRCIYVGDSATDMRTARAAGMTALGALWGFRDAEELAEAGAARLIAKPSEMLTVLDEDP